MYTYDHNIVLSTKMRIRKKHAANRLRDQRMRGNNDEYVCSYILYV
jgi:hypothetical protein